MRLTASDLVSLHRPKKCELRVFLRHRGEKEEAPDPYQEVLSRLGLRHEKKHLLSLGPFTDASASSPHEQVKKAIDAIRNRAAVIYQPAFILAERINNVEVEIVGVPDFLLREGERYGIRDSKLARRIDNKNHPEILHQLCLYGWLFEKICGSAPARLQVYNGAADIVDVQYEGEGPVIRILEQILAIKQLQSEPYEPVGWTKCLGCGYTDRCWTEAGKASDISRVYNVDQSLARALREINVRTPGMLLTKFDERSLAEFKRPWGQRQQKVGKAAARILQSAEAMATQKEKVLSVPEIPVAKNYVMFDLEGMPPYLQELDKIYLWGMQVYGQKPSEFIFAVSGFGPDGDRDGWLGFLSNAKRIFETYGDIRFVHWSPYEGTGIQRYIDRYGDVDGIGVRVKACLLDLFFIAKDSVILPLPSLSLKVVEDYVGFQRKEDEYGGSWAMATFIEATETDDEAKRKELIDKIVAYNREDLEATWAVFEWLRAKRPPGSPA